MHNSARYIYDVLVPVQKRLICLRPRPSIKVATEIQEIKYYRYAQRHVALLPTYASHIRSRTVRM